MQFKDNFSDLVLVSEAPVIFYCDDKYLLQFVDLTMKIPTIYDTFLNPHIQLACAFLNIDFSEFQSQINLSDINSKWDFIIYSRKEKDPNSILLSVNYLFNNLFNTQFNAETWTINGIEITEQLFDRISSIVLVSCGLLKYSEQQQFNIKKPQWLIDKEKEIKRIKNSNQPLQDNHNLMQEMEKIFIPINYELGYSIEQQMQMNYYHLNFLSQFISKIVRYDVMKRQVFSNKKIKYITEK